MRGYALQNLDIHSKNIYLHPTYIYAKSSYYHNFYA